MAIIAKMIDTEDWLVIILENIWGVMVNGQFVNDTPMSWESACYMCDNWNSVNPD